MQEGAGGCRRVKYSVFRVSIRVQYGGGVLHQGAWYRRMREGTEACGRVQKRVGRYIRVCRRVREGAGGCRRVHEAEGRSMRLRDDASR